MAGKAVVFGYLLIALNPVTRIDAAEQIIFTQIKISVQIGFIFPFICAGSIVEQVAAIVLGDLPVPQRVRAASPLKLAAPVPAIQLFAEFGNEQGFLPLGVQVNLAFNKGRRD